jgi:hypothetical protein
LYSRLHGELSPVCVAGPASRHDTTRIGTFDYKPAQFPWPFVAENGNDVALDGVVADTGASKLVHAARPPGKK